MPLDNELFRSVEFTKRIRYFSGELFDQANWLQWHIGIWKVANNALNGDVGNCRLQERMVLSNLSIFILLFVQRR